MYCVHFQTEETPAIFVMAGTTNLHYTLVCHLHSQAT